MGILLRLLGLAVFAVGLLTVMAAGNAVQEILGGVMWVVAAVLFVGGEIVGQLAALRSEPPQRPRWSPLDVLGERKYPPE